MGFANVLQPSWLLPWLLEWVHIAKLQGHIFNNTMPIEKPYKRFRRPSTNKSLITAVPFGGIVLFFFSCTDESSTSSWKKSLQVVLFVVIFL